MQGLVSVLARNRCVVYFAVLQSDAEAVGLTGGFDLAKMPITFVLLGLHSRDALQALLVRVAQIRDMPLDVALRDYIEALFSTHGGKLPDPARVSMLLARLGLAGAEESLTLQESADMLEITRARIHQIQEAALRRKPSHPVYLPALDLALETLAKHAPLGAQEAAQLLAQEGISSIPFRPESVLDAATFCGRAPTFAMGSGRSDRRVMTDVSLAVASPVSSLATRLATASGASNVSAVIATAEAEGIQVTEAQVRDILRHQISAEFLDESGEWFWMPLGVPKRNRLTNTTRRILAVASPVDIRTIREGVQRLYRHRNQSWGARRDSRPLIVPPRSILATFYERNPAFILEDGAVRPSQPIDYRETLGDTERVIVEVLRSAPAGILDRHRFVAECEARGVNPATLTAFMSSSPIVEHVDTGIWGLRGVHIDPVEVERLRTELSMRPRERRVLDFGWTEQGRLWIAERLPNLSGYSYVMGIPAAIQPYLASRSFHTVGEAGSQVGTIAVDDHGASWGYAPFLSREGADEGDILYVEFDLVNSNATLKLKDAEFLEVANESSN